MLLCKQPGNTRVFATADSECLSIFDISVAPQRCQSSEKLELDNACAARHGKGAHMGDLIRNTATTRHAGATCVVGLQGQHSWRLTPSWTIPFPPGCVAGAERGTAAPLSASLTCPGGPLGLFVSDNVGRAWIVTDGSCSLLGPVIGSGSVSSTGGVGRPTALEAHGEHIRNRSANIVASGWAPRRVGQLAVGRQGGLVHLLDVEGGADMCPTLLQERSLPGSLTALEWVPCSHTMILAGSRSDDCGYVAELVDVRSPSGGTTYLGAPPGASLEDSFLTRQHSLSTGTVLSTSLCCAEYVTCHESQPYVATAGSHGRRDVLQLWDLRMSPRPVGAHVHPQAGYTSLSWAVCNSPTVISTTRKGALWLHAFTNAQCHGSNSDSDDGDAESENRLLTFHSENRCRLYTGRSVVSAAWLMGNWPSSVTPGSFAAAPVTSEGWKKTKSFGVLKGERERQSYVKEGVQTDLPHVLLLDGASGELHSQAVLPGKSALTTINGQPVVSAGPNVLLVLHGEKTVVDGSEDDRREGHARLLETPSLGTTPLASYEDASTNSADCDSGMSEQVNTALHDSTDDTITGQMHAYSLESAGNDSSSHLEALSARRVVISGSDRGLRWLERIRAGFVPYAHQVLAVLLHEGFDREAYVLFRYGWIMQRFLHTNRVAVPSSDSLPGLLDLLSEKQLQSADIVLRAMGWHIDREEEQQMLLALPTACDGSTGSGMLSSSSSISPACSGQTVCAHSSRGPQNEALPHHSRMTSPLELPPSSSDAVGACDLVGMPTLQEAIERRVAILVWLGRLTDAALLLSCNECRHPLYVSVALLLEAASRNRFTAVRSFSASGHSFWMEFCIEFLRMAARTLHATDMEEPSTGYGACRTPAGGGNTWLIGLPLHVRHAHFYRLIELFPCMPLSDVIALAALMLLPHEGREQMEDIAGHQQEGADGCEAFVSTIAKMADALQGCAIGGEFSLLVAAAVEKSVNRFEAMQRYVDETGDVQTPTVYLSMYGVTDSQWWRSWNSAYRSMLNNEGHAILRSLHDLGTVKMNQLRDKARECTRDVLRTGLVSPTFTGLNCLAPLAANLVGINFSGMSVFPVNSPVPSVNIHGKVKKNVARSGVILRCKCGYSIATETAESAQARTEATSLSLLSVSSETGGGTHSKVCRDPDCLTPMCVVCNGRVLRPNSAYTFEDSFTWCSVCLHGGHWKHLRAWFSKHRQCPIDDCSCMCYRPPSEESTH
ncbi:putative Zinc ribbon like family [Trypanosoma vivax]|nr:putative Zinc ribbon like family [Trypanosoma vivax]